VIGGDAEMARYADAVTQELRTDVAGYREIRSVAVADATNIRDVTDASYVVNGNVQRRGADVRVRAGLTRTSDHQTVWAESFEQPASDKKADPAEMAATIGRFIRYQLVQDQQCESVRRTSPSAAAATAYCAAYAEGGRFEQVGGGDPQLVLRDLQHAIALDPGIADAYAGLASTYRALGESGAMDWREAARHANDALARGFALAPPNDPYLLSERGWLQGVLELNYPAAEASLRASLQADPLGPRAQWNYVGLGELALAQGNLHVALEHFRRALRINDSSATIYQFYSLSLLFLGENREAIRVANGGIDLVQGGEARFYLLICTADAHYALGETAAGNAALNQALASAEPAFKPMLLAPLGRTEEAWQLLAQLEANEHPPIPTMVFAYAVLDHDRAFEWIHTAIERHIWPVVISLRVPIYPKLREDPRWAEVMNHLESEEAKGRAGYRRVTTDHGRRQPE
jgi:TolB-like protein/Tfp pilus assembly protein PilF